MGSVADPGFPRRGAKPWFGAKTCYSARFLPKNCMKLKEIGPEGRPCPWYPSLDPPLGICPVKRKKNSFLASATKLRRLCFYTCLSVHREGGLPQCMLGYHHPHPPLEQAPPQEQAPPGADNPPPRKQTPPPSRWLLLQTVRIILECILVLHCFLKKFQEMLQKNVGVSNLGTVLLNFWTHYYVNRP